MPLSVFFREKLNIGIVSYGRAIIRNTYISYNDFCDLYFKDNGFYRIDEYSSLRTIE